MNIMMFTNTFTPHIGGVARSVRGLADGLRERGYRVVVVAPVFEGMVPNETDIVRIPALQHFRGSDFAVPMRVGHRLDAVLRTFKPDIVHAHHPFLLGDTALAVAAALGVPAVFTYHTRYELYSHYVPSDSPRMKRLVLELALGFCTLCDAVIAPSESIAAFLREHGVATRLEVIPTGVRLERLLCSDADAARRSLGIPVDVFVVGHVGRLAPEKNLLFLAEALAGFLARHEGAHALVAGEGVLKQAILAIFEKHGVESRLHLVGVLDDTALAQAYCAMDVFAFSSRSETQGLVLAEAMAAGIPVVALDAPGTREILCDGVNGRLLPSETCETFINALTWFAMLGAEERRRLYQGARDAAARFSEPACIEQVLTLYRSLAEFACLHRGGNGGAWHATRRRLRERWRIFRSIAHAVGDAVVNPYEPD